jgi:hypothetical protein
MMKLAITAILSLMSCLAIANGKPPAQPPTPTPPSVAAQARDWGSPVQHTTGSAAFGALAYAAVPNLPWYGQGALCLLPGEILENSQRQGRYNGDHLAYRVAGCATGIAIADRVKVRFAPNWVGLEMRLK